MARIARFNQRIMTSNLVNLLTLERKDSELMNALALALDLDLSGPGPALAGSAPEVRLERLNGDRLYEKLCKTCLSFGVALFAVSPEDFRIYAPQMGTELLVASMPAEQCQAFVEQAFAGLAPDRIDRFDKVLSAYTLHNGSITHAAQELFIHKNTMQSRLGDLARETGYDPRHLSDYPILAAAFDHRKYLAYKDIPDESAELATILRPLTSLKGRTSPD